MLSPTALSLTTTAEVNTASMGMSTFTVNSLKNGAHRLSSISILPVMVQLFQMANMSAMNGGRPSDSGSELKEKTEAGPHLMEKHVYSIPPTPDPTLNSEAQTPSAPLQALDKDPVEGLELPVQTAILKVLSSSSKMIRLQSPRTSRRVERLRSFLIAQLTSPVSDCSISTPVLPKSGSQRSMAAESPSVFPVFETTLINKFQSTSVTSSASKSNTGTTVPSPISPFVPSVHPHPHRLLHPIQPQAVIVSRVSSSDQSKTSRMDLSLGGQMVKSISIPVSPSSSGDSSKRIRRHPKPSPFQQLLISSFLSSTSTRLIAGTKRHHTALTASTPSLDPKRST